VAQKIQTLLIDLDGSAAEGTVRFGLDATKPRSTDRLKVLSGVSI